MEYRRYGKFSFGDYKSALFAIPFMIFVGIGGLLTDFPIFLSIFPILFSIIMAWSIYQPHRERFSVCGDTIVIRQGQKEREVKIPSNPVLVVSYADLCPTIAKRFSSGNQTYLLKGKYAVSILQKMPLETALERLHPPHLRKYTSSKIEELFDEHYFIYSFVCNQALLDELLINRDCQLIIPKSLLEHVPIDYRRADIHIDTEY